MNDEQTAPIENADTSTESPAVEPVASFEEPIGPVEVAEAVSDEAESVATIPDRNARMMFSCDSSSKTSRLRTPLSTSLRTTHHTTTASSSRKMTE